MSTVISSAEEPYRTLYWLTAQTGIRRGEVCALRVMDVILERGGQSLEQGAAGSSALPLGTSRWECCIHPWMRMVVVVHEKDN